MAKFSITKGATSETVDVFIQDSTSGTGAGKTGLLYNTAGLTAFYNVARGGSTSITLATLGSATAPYSSGGFFESDSVHQSGKYRFDIPNACLAVGQGRYCGITFQGATGMAPCLLEIELTGPDNQDSIHFGLSALPNTSITTNGSLITAGVGVNQLKVNAGIANANVVQSDSITYKNYDGTLAGATSVTVTLPTTDAISNAIADAGQFAYHELEINGGTGGSQRLLLTTATGSARQYNVLSGTFPNGADSTSTYVMHDNWRSNATLIAGNDTAATNLKNLYSILETGTLQAGGTSTIQLRSGASSVNNYYNNQAVIFLAGAGAVQTNRILTYTGATRNASLETTMATGTDSTTTYVVLGRIG